MRFGVTSGMHHVSSETSTLRLRTLRRLLGRDRQLRVFNLSVLVGEVRWELANTRAIAAVVDDAGVLVGTASVVDIAGFSPDRAVGEVMETNAPTAAAESEVEDAWQLARAQRADRVVVISPKDELLGILSIGELAAAR
jgi:CBS domain-containing protein